MDRINRENPPSDGKITSAKHGIIEAKIDPSDLSAPAENPLPLAMVSFNAYNTTQTAQLSFIDGITRTTELLNQGAEFIPFQIKSEEAEALHRAMGGKRQLVQATTYVVPPNIRANRIFSYYDQLEADDFEL